MATSSMESPSVTDLPLKLSEEVRALMSAYHRVNEVAIKMVTGCDDVTIAICPISSLYRISFTVSDAYPADAPRIELERVRSDVEGLADDSLQCILQKLYQTAQKCLGNQMINVLADKFFKLLLQELGKSDISQKRRNTAQADDLPFPEEFPSEDTEKPRKGVKMKKKRHLVGDSSKVNAKKPPMKTATDVIHRIMWDECLNQDDFIVGYMDRFVGIIEEPFSLFEWGDIAEADLLALAIPRHRIQHFKYKDIIIWDKTQRLDDVFGSTGGKTTIRDLVQKFDKENAHSEDKDKEDIDISDGEENISLEQLYAVDDVEDMECEQSPVKSSKRGKEEKAPQRPTHFLAVRVTAPELVENIRKLQAEICESDDEMLPKACIATEKLHVTLCVMRLENQEEVDLASKVLRDLEYKMATHFAPMTLLQFRTVECWQGRVVVSPVRDPERDVLQGGVEAISAKLREAGINIKDDRRKFNPHLTILKTKGWMRKKKKGYKIGSDLVEQHGDTELGCQDVDEILLCSMADKPRSDGFYHTLADICTTLE